MAKIIFYYGTMGSSKTANALMIKHNFEDRGRKAILLKPKIDTRDGARIVRSRVGIESECGIVEEFLKNPVDCDCIIIDEAQFMTAKQVDDFAFYADSFGIPVLCFGLRTDFQGILFEGSKRLMEIADNIEEITTICWCGRKARFSARVLDGVVVKSGGQIMLGGDDKYVPLCRKHFTLEMLSPN